MRNFIVYTLVVTFPLLLHASFRHPITGIIGVVILCSSWVIVASKISDILTGKNQDITHFKN